MTSIHYLTGWTVDARQELLDRRLLSWSGGPVLHLVPTRGRVIELESDHRFWLKKRQDTLIGIVYRIFEENIRFRQFKDFRPIDNEVRSLIVRKAMEQRSHQPDGLSYFNRLSRDHSLDFPGIFRTISNFFSQLTRNNFQDRFVNRLQEKIIRTDELGIRSGDEFYALESDLAWLFGDFEEIKREIRVYDADDILCSVRDFLSHGNTPYPVNGIDVIIFDGFIHLSRIEEDILFHLFGQAKEVWWLLDYDGHSHTPMDDFRRSFERGKDNLRGMEGYRIFSQMVSFMERLEENGFEIVMERSGNASFSNPVAEGLYLDGILRRGCSNTLKIRSFTGKVDEVRGIATEIKRIIRDDGLDTTSDLGRIRIIFPDLNEYSSLISEIFREYGVPFSLTSGLPLMSHPLSDIFQLIFKIPLNDFKRSDIFRLFSSGLIQKKELPCPWHNDKGILKMLEDNLLAGDDVRRIPELISSCHEIISGPDLPDIKFIDRVARMCGLKILYDGSSGIYKGLSAVRDLYQDKSAKAAEPRERENLRLEYYIFIIQYAVLTETLNPFKRLYDQYTPHDMEGAYCSILKDLGLPQTLLNTDGLTDAFSTTDCSILTRRDLKAYHILKDIISESISDLILDNELFGSGRGTGLLSGLFRIFRNRLENSFLLDEQDPNVIRISQWLEIRGRSFDYIFAGGLTDRNFPLREDTNFIGKENYRKIFRVPDNIDMSRYLFSHLLRNCRKGLYLSYPAYSEGKEVRPSNIFTDMDSMIFEDPIQGQQGETIETLFKWDESPYISSECELLDATVSKVTKGGKATDKRYFHLKNIVIKKTSLIDGIKKALRAMESRQAVNGLFEYDGLIENAKGFREFLRSKQDIFSASQLDTLANCPMLYLFERIYGLRPIEITGPEVSPMDMGAHIHEILKTFFNRLAGYDKNVSDIGINEAFSLARSDAVEYFNSIPFLDSIEFFEHQKQEFLAGLDISTADDSKVQVLREGAFAMLLRFEEENFRDRTPAGIEYRFGFNDLPSPRLGRIMLRGIIDRYDSDRKDNELFHIYDYKTGYISSAILIKKGLSFQLPVYIKSLKTCLNAGKVTAALYSLKKDYLMKKDPLGQQVCDHAVNAPGLDITGIAVIEKFADRLMDLLEAGRFHHSADMLRCLYCDFSYACHRDERRMDHLIGSEHGNDVYSGERNLETWRQADNFTAEYKKVREKMNKALNLKTPSGRNNNYESVLAFEARLLKDRDTLPFHREHIDELINEIGDFKKRYSSCLTE